MRSTWKECEACDMHVPLLSVHCSHCRKCIYALDHHCYFLGHCIGRSNQKYFIVFCLYAAMGSAIGKLFKLRGWGDKHIATHGETSGQYKDFISGSQQ